MKNDHSKCFRFIIAHGIALLSLGGGLSLLAELMTDPRKEKWAYIVSLSLVFVALAETLFVSVRSTLQKKSKRFLKLLLLNCALMFALFAVVWGFSANLISLSFIMVLASFLGLFWGTWHLDMAYKVCVFPTTAKILTVLGAITSVFGAILCAQADLNNIAAVTAVACYSTWIGAEMLVLAPVLFWNWRGMDSFGKQSMNRCSS
jgi:hypothetical protein